MPDDRVELKKRTCQFVYEEPGIKFREFFDLYMQKLTYSKKWECEDKIEFDPLFTIKNGLKEYKLPPNTIPDNDDSTNTLYHLVLPDFFDMIRRLQEENRNFAIILRTMGIDSQNFLDSITPVIEGKHRDFKDLQPIKVNPNIGQIKRDLNDRIELHMDNQIYSDEDAIYNKLSSLEGINAIRDDYKFWHECGYECYAAKPLWVNLEDAHHHHIIFDDNIRLDKVDDCIVNIRLKNSQLNEYENVEFDSYKSFEKSSILQPNLIELLNPHLKRDSKKNHYFEKIRKAEIMYNLILQAWIKDKTKLKISTIKNEELDESTSVLSTDTVLLDDGNVKRVKNKENENSNNSKRLKENEDEKGKENQTGKGAELWRDSVLKVNGKLNKKMSHVDLTQSLKQTLEIEEKVIDEQGRTITKTCIVQ